MGKPTGFIEYTRAETGHRSVHARVKDFEPYLMPCSREHIHTQSARCMDCGIPFCHAGVEVPGAGSIGCPLGNLIPEINDLAYREDWDEAYRRLSITHPFPEITGRVCPASCEGSCTAGRVTEPVAIKDIERTIASYGLAEELDKGYTAPSTGKRVAVVGGGPAGLACADRLVRKGHSVTVYERDDRAGGFLMYGIPQMKLEKEVVLNRLKRLQQMGVVFCLNSEVGTDIDLESLRKEYDAVILCTGARQARMPHIAGSDAQGIYPALDYLTASTRYLLDGIQPPEELLATGKDVLILGGGDTGTDCIATAVRQDAKSVRALEIMPRLPESRGENNPWPLWPRVYQTGYGHEEAMGIYGHDVREYETTVKEFLQQDDRVAGVVTVKVRWHQEKGSLPVPQEIPGTEEVYSAGLVIVAMGFTGAEQLLLQKMQIPVTQRGTIATGAATDSPKTYGPALPGVFAAGDARRGPSLVVWAIHEGLCAAEQCHNYLMS